MHGIVALVQLHVYVGQGLTLTQPSLILETTSGGSRWTLGYNITGVKAFMFTFLHHPCSHESRSGKDRGAFQEQTSMNRPVIVHTVHFLCSEYRL